MLDLTAQMKRAFYSQLPAGKASAFGWRCQVPVSERLLEILACPVCKVKVELKSDGSGLKCPDCKRVYPISDDIPVMLIDEAVIEE